MIDWAKRQLLDLRGAVARWLEDDGPLMGAAVAYYLGLSFFPLSLILIAGVGLFLQYTQAGQNAEDYVLRAIGEQLSPSLQEQAAAALDQVQDKSSVGGSLGILGVLIAALAGFVQFERAFNHIWKVPQPEKTGMWRAVKRFLLQRGVAFLLMLGCGVLIAAVSIAGVALSGVRKYTETVLPMPDAVWMLISTAVSLALNVCVFAVIYRFLPRAKVQWSDAFRGAVLAAGLWEIGRQILASFLIGSRYTSAYGVAGSLLAILLWCFYAVTILFLGAEYIQEFLARVRDDEPARKIVAEAPR
ncbi:MAG: YihY/virulence factor BrkB family protein [Planctomycetota bacterium]|nr:MAG: YihY/virulence factor BrkB family protein [Planctomycetota bacterium]REK28455.1 MAG: YihY/virulence factor BrkB family protein [Planctomycetota bacterium]REK29126.1 MAG: YihY/virulence factor BrkB family protein [Planctomycetota bacterium]